MGTSPTRRSRIALAAGVALVVVGGPVAAQAQTVDATAQVILSGRADPRDGQLHTVVPAYESVNLAVNGYSWKYLQDFKLILSGWGTEAFGDPRPQINYSPEVAQPNMALSPVLTGDLDIGFLEGKVLARHLTFRLGRQIVMGGAARVTQLDGLLIEAKFGAGFGLTVYGGAPVTPRFGLSRGDGAVGGRLFWRPNYENEIGVSAIDVLGVGRAVRQDVAGDLRWSIHHSFFFTAYALFSVSELRLAEAVGSFNWMPTRKLVFTADYRRVAPDLFLPLNSIFSVFSQETRDEAGLSGFWQAHPRVKLFGDYRLVHDDAGFGHRGSLKLTFQFERGVAVGVEGRVLHLPESSSATPGTPGSGSGFVQGRVFGSERVKDFFFSLDADTYYLEVPINGMNWSFTAAATAGWDFSPGWRLALSGIEDVTPFVNNRFEFLARIVWNHTFRVHQVMAGTTPPPPSMNPTAAPQGVQK